MDNKREHPPVLLFLAAFSRQLQALEWAQQQAARHWGPVALASEVFSFDQTDYYAQSMGADLKKVLLVFERLILPTSLVELKHQAGRWEAEYRRGSQWPEPRPLNLDTWYLTEAKLVLATTKDRDHRLYLDRGIFAEVTLSYQRGRGWFAREWTYPDYQTAAYHQFLNRCRVYLRRRIHVP
jgi:hypothetical protein